MQLSPPLIFLCKMQNCFCIHKAGAPKEAPAQSGKITHLHADG